MDSTRRAVLKGCAGMSAVGLGSLAGCVSDLERRNSLETGYAAFFTLWDWAEQVSGDVLTFENPVDVGATGHGWQPPGDLTANIAQSDVFIYLDSPEFSWAQTIATTLESDYDDIVVIDAMAGLDEHLLEWDHDDHHDDDHHDDGHHDHDHDDDHHHDHGTYDPHVWVDPVLATQIVETIANGLAEADPDNADTFETNADAYSEKLASVDQQFQELVADAPRDLAVLAGHDSFQYLEARYGFTLHTPVGVSPHDEPSSTDIADTIDVVNEHGIETVLYDRFESPALAETIVENSDATAVAAVTPAEGTTEEWIEQGWGYVEQMEEINIPAFRDALGVP